MHSTFSSSPFKYICRRLLLRGALFVRGTLAVSRVSGVAYARALCNCAHEQHEWVASFCFLNVVRGNHNHAHLLVRCALPIMERALPARVTACVCSLHWTLPVFLAGGHLRFCLCSRLVSPHVSRLGSRLCRDSVSSLLLPLLLLVSSLLFAPLFCSQRCLTSASRSSHSTLTHSNP